MKQTKHILISIIILIILSSIAQAVVTIVRDDGNPISGTADEKSVLNQEETATEKYVIRSCLKENQTTSFYMKFNQKHTVTMLSFDANKMNILLDGNLTYGLDIDVKKYFDADENGLFDMKIFPESIWPSYACIFIFEVTESTCKPQWDCTEWNLCSNNIQTRTCADTKKCKGIFEPPLKKMFCHYEKKIIDIKIEKQWILWTNI